MTRTLGKDYDHVYAILRRDLDCQELIHQVTITRIVWDEEVARTDVDRLNSVNAQKNCVYYFQVSRLDKRE